MYRNVFFPACLYAYLSNKNPCKMPQSIFDKLFIKLISTLIKYYTNQWIKKAVCTWRSCSPGQNCLVFYTLFPSTGAVNLLPFLFLDFRQLPPSVLTYLMNWQTCYSRHPTDIGESTYFPWKQFYNSVWGISSVLVFFFDSNITKDFCLWHDHQNKLNKLPHCWCF